MNITKKTRYAALLAVLSALAAPSVWAHATLQNSTPAKDSEVVGAPKEIVMRFNENLESSFSNAKVSDAGGQVVTTEKATLDPANASVMKLSLPVIGPGVYKVEFTAVGHDGHKRKGEFKFTVK